ncbi:ADP-ribosylglycohydrolase family protein [Shewanella sp. A25]|nr:ADP-ribosylglycohydrolase family protein [Shewanella shenzhenensis]
MEVSKIDRAKGALIGLALGDALGTTLEFQPRPKSPMVTSLMGGGPFRLKPGQWTDDTAMMLCLADSLIERGASDPEDQMRRYIDWRDNGHNSCTGTCFDIGTTVAKALRRFEQEGNALAGSDAPHSAGNGSLMRIAPVALLTHYASVSFALKMAEEASRTTHAEQRCIDACQFMTYMLHTLLNSDTEKVANKKALLSPFDPIFAQLMENMHPEFVTVINGSYRLKSREEIKSTGFVVDSLEAALWCFWHSDNFEDGAVLAANLGGDADTIAAIYGQLAGAYYGYEALPTHWLRALAWRQEIEQRAYLLLARQDNEDLAHFILGCRENIASNFYSAAYEHGLILEGFDWQRWLDSMERPLNLDNIAKASVAECLCLITVIVRRERFCEGLIKSLADNGVLQAILSRLIELNELDVSLSQGKSYFFIGDVHGQHQKLAALFKELERHDDEELDTHYVFVGDLIDNKPDHNIDQLKTLKQVRGLVDSGKAVCLMGNHELNAIGWAMRHLQTGMPLRAHSPNNLKQHSAFLAELIEDSELHLGWIEWFKSLPLFADFGDIRAIHACWDDDAIKRLKTYLNADNSLNADYWHCAFDKQHELYDLLETLLKGPELKLPEGSSFFDKTGCERHHIRVRWWLNQACTYRELAQVPLMAEKLVPELPLVERYQPKPNSIPVVIGHYTLAGFPEVLSDKVVCVDYNAAKGNNPLVSYHWRSGEQEFVHNEGIIFVDKPCLQQFPTAGIDKLLSTHLKALEASHHVSDSLLELVDELLWKEWDPIGVNCILECREEYQAYVQETAMLALDGDAEILAAWLWHCELELMTGHVDDPYMGQTKAGRLAIRLIEQVSASN